MNCQDYRDRVAIHLADAIPDRDRDRAVGLRTLAVWLTKPGAEMAAAGLLLIGTLVSIVIARGQLPIVGISIVALAASGLVVVLSVADSQRSSAQLGKWVVIAAAALVSVPLVVSASGR